MSFFIPSPCPCPPVPLRLWRWCHFPHLTGLSSFRSSWMVEVNKRKHASLTLRSNPSAYTCSWQNNCLFKQSIEAVICLDNFLKMNGGKKKFPFRYGPAEGATACCTCSVPRSGWRKGCTSTSTRLNRLGRSQTWTYPGFGKDTELL